MVSKINSYQEFLQQIWSDTNLKSRFITSPKAILEELGADVPDSVRVEVHEDSLCDSLKSGTSRN